MIKVLFLCHGNICHFVKKLEFTGLSVTFISDLKRGKPMAKIEKTIRLINILGMDIVK